MTLQVRFLILMHSKLKDMNIYSKRDCMEPFFIATRMLFYSQFFIF